MYSCAWKGEETLLDGRLCEVWLQQHCLKLIQSFVSLRYLWRGVSPNLPESMVKKYHPFFNETQVSMSFPEVCEADADRVAAGEKLKLKLRPFWHFWGFAYSTHAFRNLVSGFWHTVEVCQCIDCTVAGMIDVSSPDGRPSAAEALQHE